MSYFRPSIVRMQGYVPGEQPRHGKLIKLNTNENPYAASPAVSLAIEEVVRQGLSRYPDPLATAFRTRAGEVHGVQPDWILCGNGSDDILTIVTRALVGEGQTVRYPFPSYLLYATLAEIQGAVTDVVRFDANWSLPDKFAAHAGQPRLVYLPNPNSPSGTVIPPEKILEFARHLPCPLLVDEAYADFAEENCVSLVARCERIMVSRSLSKSHALAGLRFGYLIAQPQLIEQFIKVKDSYNCDSISIAAATAAIDDRRWLAENRARMVATRGRLTFQMRQFGFTAVDSQANFVWCTHGARDLRTIYQRLRDQGILVRYMDYPEWGHGLRISVGTDDQIDACLAGIKALI